MTDRGNSMLRGKLTVDCRPSTSIASPLARGGDALGLAVLGDRPAGDLDVEVLELLHDVDIAQGIALVLPGDEVLDPLDDAAPGLHGPVALHGPAGEEELHVEDAARGLDVLPADGPAD